MEQIDARVRSAIEEKVFPGCVIGILRDGKRNVTAYGTLDHADMPVTSDTVYDLASVTKSIPVASLAALFIEEGKLSLNEKVKTYLPELQNDHDATIEDLMRYRVKGVALSKLYVRTFEEVRTHALEKGFDGPPEEYAYTNLPAYILGLVLERVGGKSLAALGHLRFFAPLAMKHTTFFPSASDCAPTEKDARGEVRGLPHDESAYLFATSRRTVGHAGLFSTADDLLNFAEKILTEPEGPVARAAEEGLGWQVSDSRFMGVHAGPKTFGKTGFTGTSIILDTERQVALVILSNRTYPMRPATDEAIFEFRRDVADILLGSV